MTVDNIADEEGNHAQKVVRGATVVMTSFNYIVATFSRGHYGLISGTLRIEWGFEGCVITDQASVSAMFYQDMISGLWAGTDMWLNTNSSYWSLSDWTDNATVMTNVHNSAKNIVYAVTNSNAVIDYSSEDGSGTVKENTSSGMSGWRIGLICLDVVVFAACACGIVLPIVFFILDRKKAIAEPRQDN